MAVHLVIPARFASSRLGGKALADIGGIPMIAHVIAAARRSGVASEVLVATDHEGIASAARAHGALPVMTKSSLPSGTDRVAAAMLDRGAESRDIVVNIQCDEPSIRPSSIALVAEGLQRRPWGTMSTLSAPLLPEDLLNPHRVKVVTDVDARALYFSRAPIGCRRAVLDALLRPPSPLLPALEDYHCRLHVGLYAYRWETLRRLVRLPPSRLEMLEALEQLRALEHGEHIVVDSVAAAPISVDTQEDLVRARRCFEEEGGWK